jgi:hypothetical protein
MPHNHPENMDQLTFCARPSPSEYQSARLGMAELNNTQLHPRFAVTSPFLMIFSGFD